MPGAPSSSLIAFLVGMMLLTGVCNTLITKYQDNQCVRNCSSPDSSKHQNFEQPVWQTAQMFVGEMGSWLVIAASALLQRYRARDERGQYEPLLADGEHEAPVGVLRNVLPGEEEEGVHEDVEGETRPMTGWKIGLLALPAACDIAGTTLMNTGLLFVVASIYQMTRGTLVLFVGLFSLIFLKRKLSATRWFALVVVVLGVAIVGLSGMIEHKSAPPGLPGDTEPQPLNTAYVLLSRTAADVNSSNGLRTLFGMLLVFLAQTFTASQFVLEESIMHSNSISPLQMVAFEGTFGLLLTLLFQILLHLTYGRTISGQGGYFDMKAGWNDITSHRSIWASSLLIMVCIGSFNFFGLSVTRNVSATSRSTIDTCRVLFVWLCSLGLGWEKFRYLQVLGFALLVYGTFLYNEIVSMPNLMWWRKSEVEEESREA